MTSPLYRSRRLAGGRSGAACELTPAALGWRRIYFSVRHLAAGASWESFDRRRERCVVLLSGALRVAWNGQRHELGPRPDVFGGYPHAVYLPPGLPFRVEAIEPSEFADCRAPSRARLSPQIVRPGNCGYEIRGGGNATRQIVDILPPSFPADRLMLCEVFTPGGN